MSFCPCGNEADESGPLCPRCFALQVLELTPSAAPSDVRAAYYMLVKVWHPDRFQSDPALKQAANEKLLAINSAYRFLTSKSAKDTRPRTERAAPQNSPSGRAPAPAAAPRRRLFSLRNWLATFTAVGVLQRVAFLVLGFTAAGVALKVMDTTLSSDPDTARVYLPYRAAIADQLDAPRHRLLAYIENAYRRFRHQPASAIQPSEASSDQPGQPSSASAGSHTALPSKRHVPLSKLQSFITVGLTKDEVIAIAGAPTSASDDKLVFGDSEVTFKDGAVVGWKLDPASPLHVKLWPAPDVDRSLRVFSVDSTKDDVLAVQGTPTLLSADKFGYGASEVNFRNNRVVSWKNDPASAPLRAVSR